MQKFKIWFYNNHGKVYIIQYILFSIALLLGVWLIDIRYTWIHDLLPKYFLMEADLSGSILTTLSGSLLTICTFTFSTILTVCTYYTSSFSNSYIENFINNTFTMKLLGVYVGGFFYCICGLFLIRDQFIDHMVIAGSIGILYAIFCMIQFVRFVLGIIDSIQTTKIVESLFVQAQTVIDEQIDKYNETENSKYEKYSNRCEIIATDSGYLNAINSEAMIKKIGDIGAKFIIKAKIGEYIVEGTTLGIFLSKDPLEEANSSSICVDLSKQFTLSAEQSDEYDFRFNIQKIVEIAVSALGSGQKDPNTAVLCAMKLSILLSKIAGLPEHYTSLACNEDAEIMYRGYNFKENLHFAFYQLIYQAGDNPAVIAAILKGFLMIYAASTTKNKEVVKKYAGELYEMAIKDIKTSLDKDMLSNIMAKFR
ncbi:MAG: DUF2254 domain-containing protein [Ezakiella sp.]|nr:DUF2254 domain-containing protein [Ezakiella sp.]